MFAYSSQALPFSFPLAPHLSKLIRKPGCSFLWCWRNLASPRPCSGILTPAPPPTTMKSPKPSPFPALSSHLHTSLGAYPTLARKPHYVGNILFQTLLLHVWQSSISTSTFHSGCGYTHPAPAPCVPKKWEK